MMPREAVCAAIYGLPDFVTVGGRRYKINTDFRIWARIEKLLTGGDDGADSKRRLAAALALAYPQLPESAEDAVRGILWFYSAGRAACEPTAPHCGSTADGVTDSGCAAVPAPARVHSSAHEDADKPCRERVRRTAVYDFDEDFEYLWGAFLSEYGIDLVECSMHWWKFRALMMSLSEDCRFSKILAYRSMDTSKIESREVRRFYEKMKRRLSLPDRRTAEERERDTAECLEVFF